MLNAVELVIFGGAGDLSLRKLMPALYRAHVCEQLAQSLRIISTVRSGGNTREAFVAKVEQALKQHLQADEFNPEQWPSFSERLLVVGLDIANVETGWPELSTLINQSGNQALYYFALPPAVYAQACEHLNHHQLIRANDRVILEKPIGYDRQSAQQINDAVGKFFPESHILRIDHYLGKETVQNLLVLRFSNYLFELLWDSKSIDHVQITLAETVGLEGRAGFYDKAGAVRDMVQNHLLQLLCLVAMEPAPKMSAEDIRAEKIKVLNALRPITEDNVEKYTVRGQYGFGVVNGKAQNGYLDELGDHSSKTETFVAIKAHIDNWRWANVPFYIRTGKCMQQRFSEIVIQFKPVSHNIFAPNNGQLHANKLIVRLQPDENIQLQMMTKDLDQNDIQLQSTYLNLNHHAHETNAATRDAYKRLLLDAIAGDSTLFIHRDEVDASWRWLDPILNRWQNSAEKPLEYAAGTWGPVEAEALIKQDGFTWRNEKQTVKKA